VDQRFFRIKNPWREGRVPRPSTIRRRELDHLDAWLEDDEVVVISGPRRVGKSTMLLDIVHELLTRHNVPGSNIFLLDLDTLDCSDVLASPSALIDFIGIPDEPVFVLLDEVQRLDSPGLFLKGVHDLGLPIKLFVTGSSSLEMRSKVRESLSGRKRQVHLAGLRWSEYLAAGRQSWHDYLIFGGYPAVVLSSDPTERRRLLLEYFTSYLDRDIESFLRVDRLDVFKELIRMLAYQEGSLVNLNELAGALQVSRDLLRRYLSYLEETFVIRRLQPFSRNPRKELTKMPKIYFADCGWRNLVSTGFAGWEERSDRGGLLESAVESWLRQRYPMAEIRFWRTQAKAEVDFVVDDGGTLGAFEVKASRLSKPTISRSLRSFLKTYRPAQATVVNLSLEAEVEVEDVPLRFTTFPTCMEML